MLPVAAELVRRGDAVRFYSFNEFEKKICQKEKREQLRRFFQCVKDNVEYFVHKGLPFLVKKNRAIL